MIIFQMLLCDGCDACYHMTCLMPPIMVIPEGDWFCPTCEHDKLIDSLTARLKDLDHLLKENERKIKRKERLKYVQISIDNMIDQQLNETPEKSKKHKKDKKHKRAREERHREYERRQRRRNRYSSEESEYSESESEEEEEEVEQKRTRRTRKTVNYDLQEYDKVMKAAIQDGVVEVSACRFTGVFCENV